MSETKTLSSFEKLAAVNVNDKLEKKNGLSYLSWAWAVDQLLRADPTATWHYYEKDAGVPFVTFPDGTCMVFCHVAAFGKTMVAQLPVMDHRNQPIKNPNAFQINTAMQRCLVKAIALHGLGLYVYAGEDLPEGEEKPESENGKGKGPVITPTTGAWESLDPDMQAWMTDKAHAVRTLIKKGDVAGAWDELTEHDESMTEDQKVALWTRFDSKERSALKKECDKRKTTNRGATPEERAAA
jgi:hypothetical protein